MALREELWPFSGQPQIVTGLNPDHPLAPFCVGGWVSSQPGAILLLDGLKGLTPSGTTQSFNARGAGTSFGAYAGSGIISLPNNETQRLVGVNGSMACGLTLGALTSGEFNRIWNISDTSTNIGAFLVALDAGTYAGGRAAFNISGVADMVGTSGSAKQNAYATYSAEWGSSGRKLFVNGALDTTSANTATLPSSAIQPALGNRQGGGRGLGASNFLHWWFAFNINIGDAWHAEIARDPMQLVATPRIWVPVAGGGGGQTVSITAANETDTAQALAVVAATTAAITAANETDAAQPLAALASRTVAVGQVSETSTAQALTVVASRVAAIAAANESDSAQSLVPLSARTVSVGQVAETDAAQTLTAQQPGQFAAAQEVGAAQVLGVVTARTAAIAAANETDTAQAMTPALTTSTGISMALEIDAAQPLSALTSQSASVSGAQELDAAHAMTIVGSGFKPQWAGPRTTYHG